MIKRYYIDFIVMSNINADNIGEKVIILELDIHIFILKVTVWHNFVFKI